MCPESDLRIQVQSATARDCYMYMKECFLIDATGNVD